MHRMRAAIAVLAAIFLIAVSQARSTPHPPAAPAPGSSPVALPSPNVVGSTPLEALLARRRSVRSFSPRMLTIAEIGQLLWAAQGVTDGQGHRTAPSAGATYPLELYAVTPDGVFRYLPSDHALRLVRAGDMRLELGTAALGQEGVASAPLVVVITGVVARTAARYGARAERYVWLEAGHAAQNVLLQAVALGLGGVPVGAFDDGRVRAILSAPADEAPLYLIAVGQPAP
jgi:SagB-type dehydrogenase family enzyme